MPDPDDAPSLDRLGPWTALAFPTVTAGVGGIVVASACAALECLARGVFGAFLLVSGLPTLLVTGPLLARGALGVGVALAVVTSIPLWYLLGRWLVRREDVRTAERPWLLLGIYEAVAQVAWTVVAVGAFVLLARVV